MTATTARSTAPNQPHGQQPHNQQSLGQQPHGQRPQPPTSPTRHGSLTRLRRVRVVLAISALVFGVIGAWTVQMRSDGAHDALKHSGPLTQQATKLYHALSDADASAATLYLHTGPVPTDLLNRYKQDLVDASDALAAVTAEANGAKDSAADLKTIADKLPTYSEDMGYARSISNYGFPLGTRYLILASNLMQGDPAHPEIQPILGAAKNLVDTESRNLVGAEDKSSAFPAVEIVAAVALLAALLFVQAAENRRTRRLLNPGLVAATAALVLSMGWLLAAFAVQGNEVSMAKKQGADQVRILATAQVQSLQARTDEMLTLVGRGTANDKEVDYVTNAELGLGASLHRADAAATDVQSDTLARKAISDEAAWLTAHRKLRADDQQNNYDAAVNSALGEPPNDATTANANFQALQKDLDAAMGHAQVGFQTHSQSASDAVVGAVIGMGVLALAMAGAIVAGLGRRISEYQ
jgi:hypothetical protein